MQEICDNNPQCLLIEEESFNLLSLLAQFLLGLVPSSSSFPNVQILRMSFWDFPHRGPKTTSLWATDHSWQGSPDYFTENS